MLLRPSALTMPSVTVWLSEKGVPTAITHSATLSFEESPHGMTGRLVASTFSSARSVEGSTPTILAGISRRSIETVTSATALADRRGCW